MKECATHGTHYIDTTAETEWVGEMSKRYSKRASQPGSVIVHACGHDAVPWDILTFMLSKTLKARGEYPVSVTFQDYEYTMPSTETLSSMSTIDLNPSKTKYLNKLKDDPNTNTTYETINRNITTPYYDRIFKS